MSTNNQVKEVTPEEEATIRDRLGKILVQEVFKGNIFLTTIAFQLEVEISHALPTAATDGTKLIFNPDFFLKQSKDEQVFLYFHELWHCVLLHTLRFKFDRKWNYAADYVINDILALEGRTLIPGALHDVKYRDLSTEEVYELLDEPPEDGEAEKFMDLKPNKSGKPNKVIQKNMEDLIQQGYLNADAQNKSIGNIPGDIKRLINELKNPTIPWHQELMQYMSEYSKDDYSFKRPNKRYMPDFCLPSRHSVAFGKISIIIDTSGSVTDDEFTAILTEINQIKRLLKPSKMLLIPFDTEVGKVIELGPHDTVTDLGFVGYGGTNLDAPFQYLKDNSDDTMINLVFSDMHCAAVSEDLIPKTGDTLFIVMNNPNADNITFGRKINYKT